MGTAIDERFERAIGRAHDNHRRVAGDGGFVVAGMGELGLQTEKQPNRSAKNSLLLESVKIGIEERRIGHTAEIRSRPRFFGKAGHQCTLIAASSRVQVEARCGVDPVNLGQDVISEGHLGRFEQRIEMFEFGCRRQSRGQERPA